MITTINIYEIQTMIWLVNHIKKDQSDSCRNLWIECLQDEIKIYKERLEQSTNAEDCPSYQLNTSI